jgi:valyl-tRNA synthetase
MVRHLALFGETAYRSVLINGMVLGSDGRKMSKSLGNFVASPEVFKKYGADAARQWVAAGGSTGFDIPFKWSDVEYGWRFMRKLWNACRFASIQLKDFNPREKTEPELLDRWILSILERVIGQVSNAFNEYDFMNALETARNFVWHVFCDHYLEAIKNRLYGEGGGRKAAQKTLHYSLKRILQLLAPAIPHITEEIYNQMYAEDPSDSIHLSQWPEQDVSLFDEDAERKGDLIVSVIRDVRREKNRRGIPLNTVLKELSISAPEEELKILKMGESDISETVKAEKTLIIKVGCDRSSSFKNRSDLRVNGTVGTLGSQLCLRRI